MMCRCIVCGKLFEHSGKGRKRAQMNAGKSMIALIVKNIGRHTSKGDTNPRKL